MKFIKNFVKNNYLFLILFCLLVFSRFIWIGLFPTGLLYDEVEYSLSSKSFQMMGTDLSGVGFPKSLISTNTLGKISPVPYMVLSPLWNLIDLNIVTYRSLYVILNIVTSVVFMFLIYRLFNKKDISFVGGILFLLNPWSFFLSRHGMDGSFALLFYMLGAYFIISKYSVKNIILSIFCFILGFFSYHGAKLYFIPLVTIFTMYQIIINKVKGKKLYLYLLVILVSILVFILFSIGEMIVAGSILDIRLNELVFTNTEYFAHAVDQMRQASIQTPLQGIMINKVIFAARYFIGNYLEAFSPIILFSKAEVIDIHGFFYVFEFLLLPVGFLALFQKRKNVFWLITAATVVAPLSSASSLAGFSLSNRGIFLLPMLLIYITFGLYTLYLASTKYFSKTLLKIAIGSLYVVSYCFFQYVYFFILPIQLNTHYQTSSRILSKYLSLEERLSSRVIIISPKPQVMFSSLLFYLPRNEQERILKQKQTFNKIEEFTIDNITITSKCLQDFNPNNTYVIEHDKNNCYKKIPFNYLIINQVDAGTDYSIVNGKLCKEFTLSPWINPHFLSDFNIEKMNIEHFCKRWIAVEVGNK